MVNLNFKNNLKPLPYLIWTFLHCADATCLAQNGHSFHDLEKRVLERNHSVAAMLEKQQALANKLSATRALHLPELSSFYRYYPDGLSLNDDDFSSSHLFRIRLSQDLIELSKVRPGKTREISAEMDVIESKTQTATAKALFNFRKEYIEVLENQTRILHYQKLLDLYRKLLRIKKARYEHQEELLTEVLQVESELINYQGLLDYYHNRAKYHKEILAEYFDLNEFDILWDEVGLPQKSIDKGKLIDTALSSNGEIKLYQARASLERSRASTSKYDHFHLSPFIGLRVHGDRFSEFATAPELGIRFSMPIMYYKIRNRKFNQFKANESSWMLAGQDATLDLKRDLARLHDQYQLLNSRQKNTTKILQINAEKLRIERSKVDSRLASDLSDPETLIALEAETIKIKLQEKLHAYEKDKIYYEIIYRAGLLWPEDLDIHVVQSKDRKKKAARKALWVWNTSAIIKEDTTAHKFIAFCKSKSINQVYFALNRKRMDAMNGDSKIQIIISELHQQNVKVSALFGEPLWVYETHRSNLLNNIRSVLTYNTNSKRSAQFDAVHLDIEPHVLSEWPENKENLLRSLTQTLIAAKQVIATSHRKVDLEVDIPTFYHKIDENSLKKIIETADTITIMVYERTTSEMVLQSVQTMSEKLVELDTPVIVGLRAKDFGSEHALISLVKEIEMNCVATKTFSGVAIHDYHNYQRLVEK